MAKTFAPGDYVQTRLGKGVVREVRNNGRLLIDVSGRAVSLGEGDVTSLEVRKPSRKRSRAPAPSSEASATTGRGFREVDLHGLTVEEALVRVDRALDDAIAADASELRLIHGKSGSRIRNAVHRRLSDILVVRDVRLDPRNSGVTIVSL